MESGQRCGPGHSLREEPGIDTVNLGATPGQFNAGPSTYGLWFWKLCL